MRLLPREEDRLLLFLAAELARRRRERGLALSQAEACALISDAVCEAARDGVSYADAMAAGYDAVREDDEMAAQVFRLLGAPLTVSTPDDETLALVGTGSARLVRDPTAGDRPA